ncbi:hypothetical protein [Candidatus Mancarchaeum acidiphilum]|nr:hypothetical protein [Candidatus Mancarchaeum acidiphilum]
MVENQSSKASPSANNANAPNLNEAKTNIDRMLALLQSKGRMDVNTLALSLDTPASVIDDWAKILESANMVKISYELGKMYIEPFSNVANTQNIDNIISNKREQLKRDVDVQYILLEKLVNSANSTSADINSAEFKFSKEYPQIRKTIKKLNKTLAELNKYNLKVEGLNKNTSGEYTKVNADYQKLVSNINGLSNGPLENDLKTLNIKLSKTLGDILSKKADLENIRKDNLKEIEDIKRDLQFHYKDALTSINSFSKSLNDQVLKARQEISKNITSINKDKANLNTAIKSYNTMMSLYNKTSGKVDSKKVEEIYNSNKAKIDEYTNEFNKAYDEVSGKLNDITKHFGDLGNLNSQILNLITVLNDSKTRVKDLRKEINDIKREVDTLSIKKNVSREDILKYAEIIEKHSKKTESEINNLSDKIKTSSDALSKSLTSDDTNE